MNKRTLRVQQVLALTRKEAERLNHSYAGTEHLLLGLIGVGNGVAFAVLQKLGLDLETARVAVERETGRCVEPSTQPIPYTPRVKKVLVLAAEEAKALGHSFVGTEHVLLGMLREGDGVASRVLKAFNVDFKGTRDGILRELDPNLAWSEKKPEGTLPAQEIAAKLRERGEEIRATPLQVQLDHLEQEIGRLRARSILSEEMFSGEVPFPPLQKIEEEIRQIREDFFQKFATVLSRLESLAADLNRLREDVLKGKS